MNGSTSTSIGKGAPSGALVSTPDGIVRREAHVERVGVLAGAKGG